MLDLAAGWRRGASVKTSTPLYALDFARLAAQARSKAAFMAGVSFLLGFSLDWAAFPCLATRFATPARMLANPWALSFLLPFFAGLPLAALYLAHLALAAAAIAALPAALILRVLCPVGVAGADSTAPPRNVLS